MAQDITDIWFRSNLPLAEIAHGLGLQDLIEDAEDYWEWVIGTFGDVQLDVTRTHTRKADRVDTRIFIWGEGEFTAELIADLVSRLRGVVQGPISCGRWVYRSGNKFDLVVVQTR